MFSVGFDFIGFVHRDLVDTTQFHRVVQGLDYSCSLLPRVGRMLTAEFRTNYLRLGGL